MIPPQPPGACLIESRGELAGVLAVDDIALAHERWTIRSDRVDGFVQVPYPTLVLRRVRGEWKLADCCKATARFKSPIAFSKPGWGAAG